VVDEWGRRLADAQLWRTATTLDELGELTARWLEGTLLYQPAYLAARPDRETRSLITVLAAVNRRGFVTRNSQPARPLVNGFGQRAWLCGFVSQAAVRELEDLVLTTGLVLLATPPALQCTVDVPITMMAGRATTHGGQHLDGAGIRFLYGADTPEAVGTLTRAWQVDLFDPEWGENSRLWAALSHWGGDP
jgi:hypothetical protein